MGDLGRSIKSRRAVAEDLAAYLPATIELATTAILIGVTIGIALGLLSALRRNSWIDHYGAHRQPLWRQHAGLLAGAAWRSTSSMCGSAGRPGRAGSMPACSRRPT